MNLLHKYELTAAHRPAIDPGDREFFALKLTDPTGYQYGVWWTPEESRETIEQRIYRMVFAVVKELGEANGEKQGEQQAET